MRLIHRLFLLRYGISPDFVLNRDPEATPPASSPQARRARATVAAPPYPGLGLGAAASAAFPRGSESVGVAAELNRSMHALKAAAFDDATGRVDYARLRGSPAYADYRRCAAQLRRFDPASLAGDDERLAFWINLYNALIVDAVIHVGVRRSVQEVPGFFWRAAYEVGGRRYDSTDIEHGILRANRGHPAIPGPHFGAGDPRLANGLRRLDPRIHFALVCAARSCPPIAAYDPTAIDAQLESATRAFIQGGGAEIDPERGEVRLSRIFQWYAPDFGARPLGLGDKTPLLRYIAPYLAEEAGREFLLGGRPRVRFMRYYWALNH